MSCLAQNVESVYTYDADGNMLSANGLVLTYDSANRLISAGNNSYTYGIENTRVKNLYNGVETVYTYNTNANLSQLLVKTVGDTVTKYVYGVGLIGEETAGSFKTYHFDYRGSTVAITDISGTVTDTFSYDSYGNLVSRTGTSDVIFIYNGEYGVITDSNGLLYMRARYYSPELRRFVNADILMGDINNSSTLNRYAYANGNPISNIDPFGLSAERSNPIIYFGDIWEGNDHLDLNYGDLSKSELRALDWINWYDFERVTEEDYIASWKSLATVLSMGEMQKVVLEMIDHFLDGTGTEYSNEILTKNVKNHSSTQAYMRDFSKVFENFLKKYNGDVSSFANGEKFRTALAENGVLFGSQKYSYGGGLFDKDTYTGLTMAIHQWTESFVTLTSLDVTGDSYSGTLRFAFYDNFGLDSDDLDQGVLGGFRSWFILQHYDKFTGDNRPFKTVVNIDYNFSGRF